MQVCSSLRPPHKGTGNSVHASFVHQGLNQDIVAHDGAIQSAKVKAKELATKAPESKVITDTAQVAQQYDQLKDSAKVKFSTLSVSENFRFSSTFSFDKILSLMKLSVIGTQYRVDFSP